MVAIPFIYFLFLLLYILRKKKTFDVSALIVLIYVVSSFCAILIDLFSLRIDYTRYYEITLAPTVIYCLLLTIVIWPIYKAPLLKIEKFKPLEPRLFSFISYFYIGVFFIILGLSFSIILKVLTGDMSALRMAISQGDGEDLSIFTNVPAWLRPFVVIANVFSSLSMIMLLFYFYSVTFLKNSKIFNRMVFLSSTSMLLIAIIGLDRSKVVYWMLSYVFFLLLFWNVMKPRQRKLNTRFLVFFGSIVGLYFLSLTVSRFGSSDTGTGGSIIYYAGQSFINFCYYYDVHPYKGFTLQKLFPLYYKLFVENGIASSPELNREMTSKTGIFHGIFNTFLGDIMMASNVIVISIYSVAISLCSKFCLKSRFKPDFYYIIILFLFASIPMFGMFVHFYAEFTRVICFLIFLLYAMLYRGGRKFVFV